MKLFKKNVFGDENGPYMSRYIFARFKKIRTFIHHIHRKDKDPDPHSHPWEWSCGLILWGGYTELRYTPNAKGSYDISTHKYGLFQRNKLSKDIYHTIIAVKPNTWTFFIGGERTQSWSFLTEPSPFNYKPVPWREYLKLSPDAELYD